jgi:hypothetical protein
MHIFGFGDLAVATKSGKRTQATPLQVHLEGSLVLRAVIDERLTCSAGSLWSYRSLVGCMPAVSKGSGSLLEWGPRGVHWGIRLLKDDLCWADENTSHVWTDAGTIFCHRRLV